MATASQRAAAKKYASLSQEPKTSDLVQTKMDWIHALNYHSKHSSHEQMKKWALKYASIHHPKIANRLSKAGANLFATYGSVCRLADRGYTLSDEMKDRVRVRLTEIMQSVPEPSKVVKEPKEKYKSPDSPASPSLESFEAAVDQILIGEKPSTVILNPNDSMTVITKDCQSGLQELKSNPDDFIPKTIAPLKKFYKSIEKRVKELKVNRKKTVVTRRVSPLKIVKEVKYQKKDKDLGLTSINPLKVLERRKMYVYDTKYRRLIVFVSNSAGFTFTGTTLKNVDLEKSFSKTVRKPAQVLKKDMSISKLNKLFGDLTTKQTEMATGRFNPYFVILQVTDKGN